MEQRAPRVAEIVGRRAAPKAWTEEEEALLEELEVRFSGARNINKLMEPFFPGKTNRQIRSKRSDNTRRLIRQTEAAERAAEEMTYDDHPPGEDEDIDCDTITGFDVFRPAVAVEPDLDEETRLWKKALAASAVRTFHKQKTKLSSTGHEIAVQLETVAQQVRASPEVTPAMLSDLDSAILRISRLAAKDPLPEKRGQREGRRRRGRNNRLARRRHNYARLQELAKRDMKQLAHIVAEDRLGDLEEAKQSLPPSSDVRDLYHSLWGEQGETSFPPEWERKVEPIAAAVLLPPIQLSAVQKRHRALKADTAVGLDRIGKGDVTPQCLVLLTMAFNICLATGHYPPSWRTNRTTLIPKAGKDQSRVANWRPITIGSIFGRLFSGVIDECMRHHVRFCHRQKGLVSEAGTFNNVATLQQLLANMKRHKGGICSILDISKAFDSVPHGALGPALRRLGVPPVVAEYISTMYDDCSTQVKARDGNVPISLKRGVKQGDPLSPLLFNAVVDPLLDFLDRREKGITVGSRKISVLAFADDLILVSESKGDAVRDMETVRGFFQALGMTLSISKCCAFRIRTANKTWTVENPALHIDGQDVQFVGPQDCFRYLGVSFTPWAGISGRLACSEFVNCCIRVKSLGLKPQQKLDLIFKYLYPKFRYAMAIDMPSVTLLRTADDTIRGVVRHILHLSDSLTDSFFYTRPRDGGLGVPRLATEIPFAILKGVVKMGLSDDATLRELADDSVKAGQAAAAARHLRLQLPLSVSAINAERDRWARLQSQGQGVKHFHNSGSANKWLTSNLLLPNRMIDAIKLRTNTYGNRTALRRAGHNHLPVECRRCRLRPETLSHICGGCPHQKPSVIRRHEEIAQAVSDRLARKVPGAEQFHEPTFTLPDGRRLKPDLVVKDRERVLIVDYTVRYEDARSLQEAAEEKRRKYEELKPVALERLGGGLL